MPLPAPKTAWPPARLAAITPAMETWDAWWVGDTDGLEKAYSKGATPKVRPGQMSGGVVGAVSRWFWGRPTLDLTRPDRHKVHVPIATDLCQASADLVWSEAPAFTVDDPTTQERLDELVDDGMLQTFAEGCEAGAALSGHFLRVTWDRSVVKDRPFLTVVHADAADPEFRWDRLVAVTFWTVVKTNGQQVWRHLERHELDANGDGIVLHGLYQGTADDLGVMVPLTDHASTAGLQVDELGAIHTGSPGLAVVYVPHVRPQRRWRKDPVGKSLGRSVLDGVEGLMDRLDQVYSSWLRDIDLAKARLVVPESLLDDQGPGAGVSFDMDREIFSPVKALASRSDSGSLPIEAHQFKIRFEEHRSTAAAILEAILRTAGYSPATFGMDEGGPAMTATEVTTRYQRSLLTRGRMLRTIRPAVADILEKLLAVDAALFNKATKPVRPDVEFPDGVQESTLSLAQTAQALRTAEAASTDTLVRMLHPEWDDEQVTAEVARIMAESSLPVLPDPADPETVDGATAGTLSPEELAVMVQKIYLGVGTVLTSEEARAILNDAGANLTGPAPEPPAGPVA